MATLQTIRNRAGILVTIVIGLALIAFVVSDALSSGSAIFGSSRNQVGEIAGEDISIIDYQKLLASNENLFKVVNNTSIINDEHQQSIRETTWQELVNNIVWEREFEELGIRVSGDELYDMLFGNDLTLVRQLFGQVEPDQLRDYIKYLMSLPNSDPQKVRWLSTEKQLLFSRKQNKYSNIIQKALYVTDAEVERSAQGEAEKVDISYIIKNYSAIDDAQVEVSNSELKDYYKTHQNLFKQTESRRIAYVYFDVNPSEEDHADARTWIENLKAEFATTDNAMEFVNLSSDTKFNASYLKKEEITNDTLADFLFKAAKDTKSDESVFGPYIENNFYKISKVASVKMLPDSVRARHILIAPENNNYAAAKTLADSLAGLLKKGADFEAFVKQYSTDQASAVNGGDLGWFGPKTMVQPFSDTAFFAGKNEIKVAVSQFGAHIIQVRERSPLVQKMQVATIEKEILPSQTTINREYNKATVFANVTTLEEFDKQVEETGLTKRYATVSKNDKSVANISDARELVRQIYLSNGENAVVLNNDGAAIFDTDDKFIIAVLTEINEEGISPLKKVASSVKQELIRRKKGDILKKELAAAVEGSQSLLSIGQKMDLNVKEAPSISFNSFQIPGAGIEPKVIAVATLLETGKISEPIDGNQGVYIVVVNNKEVEDITPDTKESVKASTRQNHIYRAMYQSSAAILESAEIKDMRYKFY
ncbi:peptidylprolyl isomerase [Bacteroidia bacterium]|nr:peptidylprolyl isomerase [Bacteroidia bacterium]